jgi:predicted nucleotidyltransferase
MNRFPATVPLSEIAQFCRRWRIRELALFGSALRDDFCADSDLDFLVTFATDADWGLLDHIKMEQELQALLQRDVDLVSRRALERSQNWMRRQEILGTAQTLFSEQGAVHATR